MFDIFAQSIWKIRESMAEALLHDGYNYKYDVSVPLDNFYEVYKCVSSTPSPSFSISLTTSISLSAFPSISLPLSQSHSLPPSPYLPFPLSLSLFLNITHFLHILLCLSLYLSPSLFVNLPLPSLSISPSPAISLPTSIATSISIALSFYIYHSLTHLLTLSFSLSLSSPHFLATTLSLSHNLTPSNSSLIYCYAILSIRSPYRLLQIVELMRQRLKGKVTRVASYGHLGDGQCST